MRCRHLQSSSFSSLSGRLQEEQVVLIGAILRVKGWIVWIARWMLLRGHVVREERSQRVHNTMRMVHMATFPARSVAAMCTWFVQTLHRVHVRVHVRQSTWLRSAFYSKHGTCCTADWSKKNTERPWGLVCFAACCVSHSGESLESHSSESLESHSSESLESHSGESLESHSGESLESHSGESLESHFGESE